MELTSRTEFSPFARSRSHYFGVFSCCALVISVYHLIFGGLTLRDDELYMYLTALALSNPVEVDAVNEIMLNALPALESSREEIKLFDFRNEYRSNYLLHSFFILVYSKFLSPVSGYADHIKNCLSYGMFSANVLIVGLVSLSLISTRSKLLLMATTLLFLVLFVLNAANLPIFGYRISAQEDPILYAIMSVIFFASPGMQFDVFGVSARSAFTLAIVGFFVLRWGVSSSIAYICLPMLALIHSTYSGIFLFMIVAVDIVLRPRDLFDRRVALSICVTAALFFWRERIWTIFGGLEIALVGILAIGLTAFLVTRVSRYDVPILSQILGKLRSYDVVKADVILFGCGAVIVSLLAYLMTDPQSLDDRYTWMELSSRPLALIRIPVFLGLLVIFLRAANASDRHLLTLLPSIGAALLATVLVAKANSIERDPRAEGKLLQELSQANFSNLSSPRDQAFLYYYHMIREVEGDTGILQRWIDDKKPR